jgi:hypothetical protein
MRMSATRVMRSATLAALSTPWRAALRSNSDDTGELVDVRAPVVDKLGGRHPTALVLILVLAEASMSGAANPDPATSPTTSAPPRSHPNSPMDTPQPTRASRGGSSIESEAIRPSTRILTIRSSKSFQCAEDFRPISRSSMPTAGNMTSPKCGGFESAPGLDGSRTSCCMSKSISTAPAKTTTDARLSW